MRAARIECRRSCYDNRRCSYYCCLLLLALVLIFSGATLLQTFALFDSFATERPTCASYGAAVSGRVTRLKTLDTGGSTVSAAMRRTVDEKGKLWVPRSCDLRYGDARAACELLRSRR